MFFLHFHFLLSSLSLSIIFTFPIYLRLPRLTFVILNGQSHTTLQNVNFNNVFSPLSLSTIFNFTVYFTSLLLLPLNGQSHTTLQNVNFNNVFVFTFTFHYLHFYFYYWMDSRTQLYKMSTLTMFFFHFHFLLSSLLLLPLNGQLHTTLQNVLSSLSLSTIFNFTFTIYFK